MTSLLGAEQVGVAHGTADDAPQHVAAALVRREHAVGDEHRGRAGVLGEHAHREAVAVVVVADPVGLAGDRLRRVDQRLHQVGLPHGVDALQQGEDALEPGAGVDRRLRQQRARAVGRLVVLHEHQVPELHEPVAVRIVERPAVGAERRAAVDVDLGARTARAGVAHLPEVVLVAEPLDALERHADLLVPDRLGLVVGLVDGDPQPVAVEAPAARRGVAGDEVPAPGDDLVLEVVAEAEVAEHLEEHEVALGAADVVEVVVLAAGAGALLRADRPRVRRHLVADEVRLERHHAGDGEHDRRVVRDEARRRHDGVVLRGEEVEERQSELVGADSAAHEADEPTDAGQDARRTLPSRQARPGAGQLVAPAARSWSSVGGRKLVAITTDREREHPRHVPVRVVQAGDARRRELERTDDRDPERGTHLPAGGVDRRPHREPVRRAGYPLAALLSTGITDPIATTEHHGQGQEHLEEPVRLVGQQHEPDVQHGHQRRCRQRRPAPRRSGAGAARANSDAAVALIGPATYAKPDSCALYPQASCNHPTLVKYIE